MARSDFHLVNETGEIEQQFRSVMRRLAGGVSIITAGRGNDITGMTVTSLTSLSATPPRLLVSINRQASSSLLIGAAIRGDIGDYSPVREPPKQSPGLWYVPPAIWAQNRKSPRTYERVAVEFTPRQSTSAYVLMTERAGAG